ncbi:MAG TPA: GAP family protein [Solirubrobacteraceae bacterium]|nr:GAP family protein [Solirubrobacteraceae bacterium]
MLALVSAVRPTSLAAVYALARGRSPRRLMTAYLLAGLAFTVAFGLVVVWLFNGVELHSGTGHTKGIAEIVAGIMAIGFGVGVLSGRVGGRQADDAPSLRGRWQARMGREVRVRTAALAGPATHIPGLFYLLALDLIVASQRHLAGGVLDVLLYNVIWFALPIGALAICIVDPPAARRAVEAIRDWASAHARAIVLVLSFGIGSALLVTGVLSV